MRSRDTLSEGPARCSAVPAALYRGRLSHCATHGIRPRLSHDCVPASLQTPSAGAALCGTRTTVDAAATQTGPAELCCSQPSAACCCEERLASIGATVIAYNQRDTIVNLTARMWRT